MAAAATVALNITISGQLRPGKTPTNFTKFTLIYPNRSQNSSPKSSTIRALDPETREGQNSSDGEDAGAGGFVAQEDVDYLMKLVGGSIIGGAAIKYGSIVFPAITKPNIIQALLMISAPVVIAIWLLIKQSRSDVQS